MREDDEVEEEEVEGEKNKVSKQTMKPSIQLISISFKHWCPHVLSSILHTDTVNTEKRETA